MAIGLAGVWTAEQNVAYHGRGVGEIGYRCFMACYGLLFPVYVLMAIGRPRVATAAWVAVTVVALPLYWMAFIEGWMAWATLGVAVVVVGASMGRVFTLMEPGLPAERTE